MPGQVRNYSADMSSDSWLDVRDGFNEAVHWFVRTVAQCAETGWDAPGLGQWSVRALVGHTSRALITVESYVARPQAVAEVESARRYFQMIFDARGDDDAVAQRGRDAGAALGVDPAGAVAELADRVLALVARSGCDVIAGTPVGGMRLVDYLPTRTFELTVHTADLTHAIGAELHVPPTAGGQSLDLIAQLASASGQAGALLLAATGRGPLPLGFTVLRREPAAS